MTNLNNNQRELHYNSLIPNFIMYDLSLHAHHLRFYSLIEQMESNPNPRVTARFSYAWVAEVLGVKRRRAIEIGKDLKDKGYIKHEQIESGMWLWSTFKKEVIQQSNDVTSVPADHRGGGPGVHPPGGPGVHPKYQEIKYDKNKDIVDFKKSPKNKQVNLKDYKKDPRFMKFYDPYPKKEKPREAYKAFLSIVADDDELLERIIVDIELRKEKHEQWQDMQYISHPATYLRSEEFNGEIYDHKKIKDYKTEHQDKNKAIRDRAAKEAQDALIKNQDDASLLKQRLPRTNEKRRVDISNSAESAIDILKRIVT